jgi:sulfate-transporting ATPase
MTIACSSTTSVSGLPPGGIVGVIGPNGAGKTTLFRMLVGQEKPDTGELKMGPAVELGYVDQNRDALDPNKTVWEEISGGHDNVEMGGRKVNSRAYVARFNFSGTDQQKLVGQLSGGERNRVHLAKLLRRGSNVLLLDEPSNDLDVDTLRALEEGIANYAGCVVVISHDRWFLDRLATHILAFEGDGYVPLVRRQLPNLRRTTQTPPRHQRRRTPTLPLQKAATLK